MDGAAVAGPMHLDPGRLQPRGVGLALAAERIVFGGQHQGRRQAGHVLGEGGRRMRMARLDHVAEIEAVEIGPVPGLEEVQLAVRAGLELLGVDGVGQGIDQHLAADLRAALVAGAQGHHGGQVAAGAVAADRDARSIAAEVAGMLGRPAQGGEAVVRRGGEGVLRRQAIVDRHGDAAGLHGEDPRHLVVGVQVAQDEAAAVHEHQHRQVVLGVRPVDAQLDVAARPRDVLVDHLGDGRGLEVGGPGAAHAHPQDLERHLAERGRGFGLGEQGRELRIDGHQVNLNKRLRRRRCGLRPARGRCRARAAVRPG